MEQRVFNLTKLVADLGFQWQDKHVLEIAMTHTSFANENRHSKIEHNQRLEFLGDAVLELVISDYLYNKYPHHPEGILTKIRAAVVCEPSLASVALELNLGNCLLMGKGEERTGGRGRPSILADAFEALVGAIYVDQGLELAAGIIHRYLVPVVVKYDQGGHAGDYKSELQELVQQESDNLLVYHILEEEGPDHNKTFTAGVKYEDELWGVGKGKTKKEAEQAAAKAAMDSLAAKRLIVKKKYE